MATGTPAPEALFLSAAGEGALKFRRLQLRESLGRLSNCVVELVRPSTESKIAAKDVLGTQATVKLLLEEGSHRYLNGWVTRFERGGIVGRHDIYRLELRPWLWYLTLGQDSRVFQDKTALQILEAVFAEYGAQPFENKLRSRASPRTRGYCVQYRESDFDFVCRLMEEEGWYYYFTHEDGKHTLVLADSAGGHSPVPGDSLAWAPTQDDDRYREDVIVQWSQVDALDSIKHVRRDHDYLAPTTDTTVTATRNPPVSLQGDGEVFDYPGRYSEPGKPNIPAGQDIAQAAVDADEACRVIAVGATRYRPLALGMTFTFKDYPTQGATSQWLVSRTDVDMAFGNYEAGAETTSEGYQCSFEAVPKTTRFQPDPLIPRPVVRGPQTAVVVGPSGDEIHTDEHARVKVQFHWDRVGQKNESSSCWVRVATPWASKGYGMVALPRIGDEVVVSFLEGDPDRPLITGSVYNANNTPPWTLPAQATVSGIKTRSSKQGDASTANELRFDDKKGSEYIWMQAQKNFHLLVKNNANQTIANDAWTRVDKNSSTDVGEHQVLTVGKTASLTVGEDSHVTLGADLLTSVAANLQLDVGANLVMNAGSAVEFTAGGAMDLSVAQALSVTTGAAMDLNVGAALVINASSGICLRAGSGFILIDGSGVTIQGPVVKINSGGAAQTAKQAKKASPPKPTKPTLPDKDKDPLGS